MNYLNLVNLALLMRRTSGSPDVKIGLIDGPVNTQHNGPVSRQSVADHGAFSHVGNVLARDGPPFSHGPFIAGILSANRGSAAPAICPNCPLVVRPIFHRAPPVGHEQMLSASPEELATAIVECIDAGVRVINLSVALAHPSINEEPVLKEALDEALRQRVIVIAAAGNQGTLGTSAITRHPWIIPVVACDLRGKPMKESNLGRSIGRWGLMAPGDRVTSIGSNGRPLTLSGTSVAVPFVTGTVALLWSEFRSATADQIKLAVTYRSRPTSVVPSLLDAEAAYQVLVSANS